MAFAISSRFAQIGSSGENSGRGASARRCSISAGEDDRPPPAAAA